MKACGIAKALPMALAVVWLASSAGLARAHSYYGQWVNNWTGSSCAPQGALSYTDDQINIFAGRMDSLGQTRVALYGNGNVWTSDVLEDRDFSGSDWSESDAATIYAFSGHGGSPNDGSGLQTFQAPYYAAGSAASCTMDSKSIRWGEVTGYYASPHTGINRWAIFCTCFSADTDPYNQWIETFDQASFEYVMGYRGLSADSPTTDEVPAEWASYAIGDGKTFKQAWFDGATDWFVDDTAEVVASGTSTTHANTNRDGMKQTWARHVGLGWSAVSWAWHQG